MSTSRKSLADRELRWSKGTLAIGLAAGLAAALGLAKVMASILFNVSPYDPLVFFAVPCVIALSSLPAILRPAWRAAKVDPSSLFRMS